MSKVDVPSFNELAKQLDPMLPQRDYDMIREKYFQDHVQPRISNPTALPQVWEEFKAKTERTPLLSPLEKVKVQVDRGLIQFGHSMMLNTDKGIPELDAKEAQLEAIASREGMSNIPPFIGSMVGQIPPSVALAEVMGPLSGAITSKALTSARAIGMANRVLTGGLAYGTYEALSEQQGDRLMAGARGFAVGAGFDLVLGLPGFLRARGLAGSAEEAEKLAKDMLSGEPPKPGKPRFEAGPEGVKDTQAQAATAEYLKNQAATSRKEGNPNLFMQESEAMKGVWSLIEMPDGKTLPIEIKPGTEAQAMNAINKLLDQGGAIDTFQWHPNDVGRANKFIRELADKRNLKYDENVFVRTQTGKAPADLAKELNKEGVPAEVKKEMVSVPTTEIRVPKAKLTAEQKFEAEMEALRKSMTEEASATIDESVQGAKAQAEATAEGKGRQLKGEEPKMSKEQAILLVKRLGRDPLTADIEAIQHMGEEEINRLFETVQKQRAAGVGASAGTMEERMRKGEIKSRGQVEEFTPSSNQERPVTEVKAGQSKLLELLGFDPGTYQLVERPGSIRMVVDNETMNRLGPNFNALTNPDWKGGLRELGVSPSEIAKLDLPNSPLIVVRSGAGGKTTLYHEGIHGNLINSELNPMLHVPEELRGVATELVSGMGSQKGYGDMSFTHLVDEAFTYAAQAVRFNDSGLLHQMGQWDKSPEHVLEFVNGTSKQLLKSTYGKLDTPGIRIFQRRLEDLIRRTDDAIIQRGKQAGIELSYEPDAGAWAMFDSVGTTRFKSLNDAWDWVFENEVSDYSADPSFWAQVRGVKGGLTEGPPPKRTLPLPNFPLFEKEGSGLLSLTGLFRPFLPWVSSLDYRINRIIEKAGKFRSIPIYDAVKAVDEGEKLATPWLLGWREKFGKELSNWTHDKQRSLFELMSFKPEDMPKAAESMRVTPEELLSAQRMSELAKDFSNESGVNLHTYWKDFYPQLKHNAWQPDTVRGWGILKKPGQQGFWERNVTSGELDPSDNHMGRFLQWAMQKGSEEKFTGKALDRLQKIVDLKTPEGAYLLGPTRWPLKNYVNYMRGIPDNSAQIMTRMVKDVQGSLSSAFKKMNPSLPSWAQLPEEFNAPTAALNRLMLLSYTAGLALRPAVTVRDALQVFITGMPIIGPNSFVKGLTRTLTREGWDFAENSGALLSRHNIGELYGDVFKELPLDRKGKMAWLERFSQKLLGPSRWGNNLSRAIVYNGAYDDANLAISAYQKGAITSDQFLERTHLWFAEGQQAGKFLARAGNKEAAGDLAREIALEAVENTQFAYRKGAQPSVLRTGMGRILGQYGSWPLNYAEFLNKLGKRAALHQGPALRSVATWAAVNTAASKLMEGLGVESSQWLWTSPASYTGGPALQLAQDLSESIGSTDQAKSARARVLRYPLNFVPASIEMRSIITAMEGKEDLSIGGKGFMRAMGFKPLNEVQSDPDYIKWVLEESGLTANPYKR